MKKHLIRTVLYLLGIVVLAFGIVLNTKASLGVSSIITISYSIAHIWNLNFANTSLIMYSSFVIIEMILRGIRKEKREFWLSILQIPFSIVFTRFMNIFDNMLPDFKTVYNGSFWGSIGGRFIVLLAAILLTGWGVVLTVNPRLVPNPADGIVHTISECIGKNMGLTKNIFDISCVAITCALCLIANGKIIGVGIGTVASMLLIGRVIAITNHFVKNPMEQAMGISTANTKTANNKATNS